MKNAVKLLGIIAIVTIIGFSMIACDGSGGGSSFEGTWYDRDPNNPTTNYAFFRFTGDEFLYQNYSQGQMVISRPGTFTYTNSQITFIPPPGTWTGWTTSYTRSGNTLFLQDDGMGRSTNFIKQ